MATGDWGTAGVGLRSVWFGSRRCSRLGTLRGRTVTRGVGATDEASVPPPGHEEHINHPRRLPRAHTAAPKVAHQLKVSTGKRIHSRTSKVAANGLVGVALEASRRSFSAA